MMEVEVGVKVEVEVEVEVEVVGAYSALTFMTMGSGWEERAR
jgi:hypothetical protein